MIAHIGLVGSNLHTWRHVTTKAEAETFFAEWLEKHGVSEQTLQAYRDRGVISNKLAAKIKYQNGKRVYVTEAEQERALERQFPFR